MKKEILANLPVVTCALLALFLTAAQCGDNGPTRTTSLVGPDGGLLTGAGASVDVLAGALEVEVELGPATVDAPVVLPEYTQAASPVFALTPHGQAFSSPVDVELPFSGQATGLSVLVLADESDTDWESVPGVSFADGLASFQVDHLSFYVVTRSTRPWATLVTTITLPDSEPQGLMAMGDHDLVIYARDASVASSARLRFLDVTYDELQDTFDVLRVEAVSILAPPVIPDTVGADYKITFKGGAVYFYISERIVLDLGRHFHYPPFSPI